MGIQMKAGVTIAVASVTAGWALPVAALIGVEVADHFRSPDSDDVGFGVAAFGVVVITVILSSVIMLAGTLKLARAETARATRISLRFGVLGLILQILFLLAMLLKSYV